MSDGPDLDEIISQTHAETRQLLIEIADLIIDGATGGPFKSVQIDNLIGQLVELSPEAAEQVAEDMEQQLAAEKEKADKRTGDLADSPAINKVNGLTTYALAVLNERLEAKNSQQNHL